jgi:hypothetical protein
MHAHAHMRVYACFSLHPPRNTVIPTTGNAPRPCSEQDPYTYPDTTIHRMKVQDRSILLITFLLRDSKILRIPNNPAIVAIPPTLVASTDLGKLTGSLCLQLVAIFASLNYWLVAGLHDYHIVVLGANLRISVDMADNIPTPFSTSLTNH